MAGELLMAPPPPSKAHFQRVTLTSLSAVPVFPARSVPVTSSAMVPRNALNSGFERSTSTVPHLTPLQSAHPITGSA